jgi:tripartite-type tricarboxylate transporter receptor subunit TctC
MTNLKLPRRNFLHLATGAAALSAIPHIARAQAYPTRPVRLIVDFPPGDSDIVVRLVGQWLSERLGQPFVIENRPPAVGSTAELVARALPDGYTLLWFGSANAVNAMLYDKLNVNFIRDFAPVGSVYRTAGVMVVNPSFPANSIGDFIAYAKANPGKVYYGSAGIGTPPHLNAELFKMMTGVNLVHVGYLGDVPAVTDLLNGHVHVMFATVPGASNEHILSGKLRALAVTTATRWMSLPNVPTVGEFVPGFETSGWFGIASPKNTPVEIIDKLNREINAGLADPKLRARFADLGSTVLPGSPGDFGKLIADETEKWGKVIRAANIKRTNNRTDIP